MRPPCACGCRLRTNQGYAADSPGQRTQHVRRAQWLLASVPSQLIPDLWRARRAHLTTPPTSADGCRLRAYHAHSLLQIAATHPVVLVDRAVPPWARPYLTGEVTVSLSDPGEVTAAVGKSLVDHSVGRLVTYQPRHARLAAHLAQHLGLPGNSPATVATCQAPVRARHVLREADVPSVQVHTVDDVRAALDAARTLGFPVSLTAPAVGTDPLRADCASEVRSAYQTLRRPAR